MNNKIYNDGDIVKYTLFGKEIELSISDYGQNKYDEDGHALTEEESKYINQTLLNIKLENYLPEILDYCNECYEEMGIKLEEKDIEGEITIMSIVINLEETDEEMPTIFFLGECECGIAHGIVIGFRNDKCVGVGSADWVL